jgi:hypothetical protein
MDLGVNYIFNSTVEIARAAAYSNNVRLLQLPLQVPDLLSYQACTSRCGIRKVPFGQIRCVVGLSYISNASH